MGNVPYADVTPSDSTMTFAEILDDADFIKLASPNLAVGDPCADFDLPTFDFSSGTRGSTGNTFHLEAEAANRPVALIFGSYT